MDIALVFRQGSPFADIELDGTDLKINEDLSSSVGLSLFSDRLADKNEVPPGSDRKGFWGDTYSEVVGSLLGSKLWLLWRSKATQENANLAKEYCYEALQWLIEDKIADLVTVETEIQNLYTLAIDIKIFKPDETLNYKYSYVWSQI